MKKIRIALFTGNYNHIRDGVSLTLNRLVSYLLEQGVDVLIIGPTVENPEVDHVGEFIAAPSVKAPGRPEYRITTGFPASLKNKVKEFNPDLIHIATPDVLGYQAMKFALRNKIPIVSSYHTHFTSYLKYYKLQFIESLGWKYLRWFYGHCRQIFVPTESMAETIREHGISGDIRIWARGVDMDVFNTDYRSQEWRDELGIDKSDVLITFISRLVWEKNLDLFSEVTQNVMRKNPNAKAMIVGDGPILEELQEMFPKGIYTGFLTGEDLSKAYANSDIFFFPSDTETFGNVTLEAMASGLPCLVADAVGSKSLVNDQRNGFLVPVENRELFKKRLGSLITDSSLRDRMGKESTRIAKEYSWENINGKLLSYYQEVLSQD